MSAANNSEQKISKDTLNGVKLDEHVLPILENLDSTFEKFQMGIPEYTPIITWGNIVRLGIFIIVALLGMCIFASLKGVGGNMLMFFGFVFILLAFLLGFIVYRQLEDKKDWNTLKIEEYKFKVFLADSKKKMIIECLKQSHHQQDTAKTPPEENTSIQMKPVELSHESINELTNSMKSLIDKNNGDVKFEDVKDLIKTILANNSTTNITFIK